MIERVYLQPLIKCIKEARIFIQVIVGPRQIGNTTTLAHYLSLLSDCGLLGGISKYAGEEIPLVHHNLNFKYIIMHYWRERNDEVDFVMEQRHIIGIEVKSGRRGENKGMSVFASKFNLDKVLLVGTGGNSSR